MSGKLVDISGSVRSIVFYIFREEIEPIGDGPQYNPDGRADVSTSLHGSQNKYTITANDFVRGRDTPAPKKTEHRFSQRI